MSRARAVQIHANTKYCLAMAASQDFYANLHFMAVFITQRRLDELQQLTYWQNVLVLLSPETSQPDVRPCSCQLGHQCPLLFHHWLKLQVVPLLHWNEIWQMSTETVLWTATADNIEIWQKNNNLLPWTLQDKWLNHKLAIERFKCMKANIHICTLTHYCVYVLFCIAN